VGSRAWALKGTKKEDTIVDGLLSTKEAAKVLACSVAMPRHWLYPDLIPRVKVGRLTRLRQRDVEAWVRLGLPTRGRDGNQ
jgi:excisionase family DNA binding protein